MVCFSGTLFLCKTHVELPLDLVGVGLGLDLALEVDVVALLDAVRLQLRAEHQAHAGEV